MKRSQFLALIGLTSALSASVGCGSPSPGPAPAASAKAQASAAPRTAPSEGPPAPYIYPAPVKGHYEEANIGTLDLVDGIAYTAKSGGTVVYVTGKSIASPVLATSTCPMTHARALTLLRDAPFLEVKLDAAGRSDYFAGGRPLDGKSRETEMGSHYWKIDGGKVANGRVAGHVTYRGHGQFDFDLPVATPGVDEVSEGDRVSGKREQGRKVPTEAELVAAYTEVRRAALAKDWKGLLAAQGFDAKQSEAIRGLPGIEADFAAHADRFLTPGTSEGTTIEPGYASLGAHGKNSKEAKFYNYYVFSACGDKLVLVAIAENPQ
jgi:hypothetical protein